jgi:hypothetical protein
MKNLCKILFGKLERKTLLGRYLDGWKDNIKIEK